ncbi:MAG TPA: aconitase X catalytic domain-containing protein [Burkholderiales bacterium]|nr:aconitase X catalytic domain-containing protein [Burkholderiales bacterium]
MRLSDLERAMLAGDHGAAVKSAIEHQVRVGEFFGAADFVPVTQAHIMADTESLGEAGVAWVESLAKNDPGARVRVPTIMDPRGTDFAKTAVLKQPGWAVDLERRAVGAFSRLGILMTDTCINYQTIQAPARGESVAFGDTGVVIYSNSACGARSNFEGGPSALAAGLTGRTPRYGFHLDEARRASVRIRADWTPVTLNDWGALGAVVGRLAGNYWAVPVVEGLARAPGSDELKHFGAAMASFGSIALFHLVGITPEAARLEDVGGEKLSVLKVIKEQDIRALQSDYAGEKEIDVVVFSAPQLSLYELRMLAGLCEGRRFVKPLLAITSPQVKPDADRFGLTERIERAGGHVLSGMCFYQSYAREIAEANGWKRLATNSTKLVNILGGYGYVPLLATMERCVEAAEKGRLP